MWTRHKQLREIEDGSLQFHTLHRLWVVTFNLSNIQNHIYIRHEMLWSPVVLWFRIYVLLLWFQPNFQPSACQSRNLQLILLHTKTYIKISHHLNHLSIHPYDTVSHLKISFSTSVTILCSSSIVALWQQRCPEQWKGGRKLWRCCVHRVKQNIKPQGHLTLNPMQFCNVRNWWVQSTTLQHQTFLLLEWYSHECSEDNAVTSVLVFFSLPYTLGKR